MTEDDNPLRDAMRKVFPQEDSQIEAELELADEMLPALRDLGYMVVPAPQASDHETHINIDAAVCPLCRAEHQFSKIDPVTGELIVYPAHNAGNYARLEKMLEGWSPPWADDEPAAPDTPLDAPHPYLHNDTGDHKTSDS